MTTSILHYFYERDGITLILNNGEKIHQTTPNGLTSHEHLQLLKIKKNFRI